MALLYHFYCFKKCQNNISFLSEYCGPSSIQSIWDLFDIFLESFYTISENHFIYFGNCYILFAHRTDRLDGVFLWHQNIDVDKIGGKELAQQNVPIILNVLKSMSMKCL